MKKSRRKARELALQGLYQWRVSRNEPQAIENQLRESEHYPAADDEYLHDVLYGVAQTATELEALIAPQLDRPFAELSPVEYAILLLATYELTHKPGTPYRVIINEAIELAKSYGGTDGHKYVNGVLDKLAAILIKADPARAT